MNPLGVLLFQSVTLQTLKFCQSLGLQHEILKDLANGISGNAA